MSAIPPKAALVERARMSALCQKRTYAVQQTVSLFDYVVSELSELHRHIQAERLGGLEVDYQLELGGA